jgi:hypothetical protein
MIGLEERALVYGEEEGENELGLGPDGINGEGTGWSR